MKLFKKVLAVVLVGAMAVSMLTACGSSEVSKVKDALKDAGIAHNSAMTADANDAMSKLQKATNAIAAGELDMTKTEDVDKVQAELAKMADFSFNDPASGTATSKYDLYIWTNGAGGHQVSSGTEKYPYLMKVQAAHVSKEGLKRLLQKDFVQQGEFSGNSEAVDILRSLLKGAAVEKAGISIGKVYGKDVLLVTVPAGTAIPQTAAPKTLTT